MYEHYREKGQGGDRHPQQHWNLQHLWAQGTATQSGEQIIPTTPGADVSCWVPGALVMEIL